MSVDLLTVCFTGDMNIEISETMCIDGWYNFSISINDTDLNYISNKLDHLNKRLSNITDILNDINTWNSVPRDGYSVRT